MQTPSKMSILQNDGLFYYQIKAKLVKNMGFYLLTIYSHCKKVVVSSEINLKQWFRQYLSQCRPCQIFQILQQVWILRNGEKVIENFEFYVKDYVSLERDQMGKHLWSWTMVYFMLVGKKALLQKWKLQMEWWN